MKDAGRKIVLLPFDLRDEQAPKEIIDKAVSELGGLDTMVLNAGQQISCQSIAELPLEQVKDTFMINIIAMFALVKEAVPHIPAGGSNRNNNFCSSIQSKRTFIRLRSNKSFNR